MAGRDEEDTYLIQVKRRPGAQRQKRNTKIFLRKQREEISKAKRQKVTSTLRELRWLYGWIAAEKKMKMRFDYTILEVTAEHLNGKKLA